MQFGKDQNLSSSNKDKKTQFVLDVSKIVSGTTFAQLLTILASPILTRLYGPEAFGILALFISIAGVIVVIACLRYELSIMLPESDGDAVNILGLCILVDFIISLMTVPIIWFGKDSLCQFLNAPNLGSYLWMIPVFIFFSGLFVSLNYWNSRTKHFGRLSVARVTSSSTTTGIQIGSGYLGYASGGSLIAASVAGQCISSIILAIQIWRDDFRLIKSNISFSRMREGFYRYQKFPLIDSLSSFLNVISWQLPVFLLSAFFSPIIVGLYALGFRIFQVPMNLIGGSISQVFFQRATEAERDGSLSVLVENVVKMLVLICLFPILVLAVIGQDIFIVIFGQIWAEAGIYTQILSIWALVWFVSSPISLLYIVFEKQEFGLKFNIINFFTRLGSLVIGGLLGSPIIALLLFASSGIVVYGYLLVKMFEFSNVNNSRIIKNTFSNFLLFVPAGILLIIMKLTNFSSIQIVVIGALLCILYYAYIIKTNPQIKQILSTFISIPSR